MHVLMWENSIFVYRFDILVENISSVAYLIVFALRKYKSMKVIIFF